LIVEKINTIWLGEPPTTELNFMAKVAITGVDSETLAVGGILLEYTVRSLGPGI
jgi:hypothetical protein